MSLFKVIPDSLFSILSSPNRHLYVEALFVLRKAFKSEYTIERDTLLTMLTDRMGELEYQWQADEDANIDLELADRSDISRALMRRLEQTGWLELEYKQTSFDELVTIPPYAVAITDVLWSLTEASEQEYGRHAFLTYTMLKSAESIRLSGNSSAEAEEAWMAIDQAARESSNLLDALKTLLNNIRRYHRMLSDYLSTSEILEGHFDQFQVLINERVYHPLKTRDAVQRYRVPVLSQCDQLLSDSLFLESLAKNGSAEGSVQENDQSPLDQIISWLHFIYEVFDHIEDLLTDIDHKNRAYTRASTDRLLYMINREDNIRSNLISLIRQARSLTEPQQQLLTQSPQLMRQRFLDHRSLYLRTLQTINADSQPMAINPGDEAASLQQRQGASIDAFLREAASRYTHQQVIDYVERLLGSQQNLASEDIPLNSDEDYILLILAIVKQHERLIPYRIQFTENQAGISETQSGIRKETENRQSAYTIPRFVLQRKITVSDNNQRRLKARQLPDD